MNDLMTKSFLSYVELKKQALNDLEGGHDIEAGCDLGDMKLTSSEEEILNHFFDEVGQIKSQMDDISGLLVDLQQLGFEAKSAHSTKVIRGIRDRMDSDMVSILKKANIIKARLGALDASNDSSRRLSGVYKEGSLVDRTRTSVTNGLRAKLKEMMIEFQCLRERSICDHKEDIKRRYFAATGEIPTDEMIERMSLEGDKRLELDVEGQERHKAMIELRRSLTKLHKIFLDMAILVEAQQEPLNNIEENVARAQVYISGGTDNLAAAKAMKKKGKGWVKCLCILAAILLLVCLIPIFTGS